ncbi:MAG TPA: anthranilate phosphoribosyltransferase, partial [Thermoanaerobaculia bacterium]
LRDGEVRSYEMSAGDAGVETHRLEELAGGDIKMNAAIARSVLEGKSGAAQDVVVLNAGAALYVAGSAASVRDGVALARQAIVSGRALAKLEELIKASRSTNA